MASRVIRPSTTRSLSALWAKSLLNALLFFAIFMVALPLLAGWLSPTPVPLLPALRWPVAIALFVLGITVWIICLDVVSRRGHGTPFPLDAPRDLVTTGPFAYVRNPIMMAELMVIWAEAVYFSVLGVLLYAAIATIAGHVSVVYVEEPDLRARFGDAFETYCSRVPRWFPRVHPRHTHTDGG